MIDWATIKQQLAAAVVEVGELQPNQVIWQDEATGGTWQNEPTIFLKVRALNWQGIEEERREDVPGGPQIVTLVNQRKFMFSMRVESFEQDVASPRFAGNILDQIATRLKRSSVRAQIDSCAIETWQPAKSLSYKANGRQVSAWVLDGTWRTVDLDVDTSVNAGEFINEAQISGAVTVPPDVAIALDVTGA